MFEIEKDIPVPDGKYRRCKYPFPKMAVGDSILVPPEEGRNASARASKYGKDHGVRFATRTVSNGLRVWRIE